MPSDNTVTIGNWTASDGPQTYPDSDGVCWVLSGIDGWFGGLSVRSGPIDRPQTDGTIDGPAPFGGRAIALSGTVIAPDRSTLQAALDRLAGILAGTTRRDVLTVAENVRGLSRITNVRLDGPTLMPRTGPRSADWSLALYANDPLRYSADLRVGVTTIFTAGGGRTYNLTYPRVYGAGGQSGLVAVTNEGNSPMWPIFQLTGPLTNPTVRFVGGPSISVQLALAAGQVLTIDSAARTVLLDGASRRSFVTADSQWFTVPPGNSQIYFTADSGAGTLAVQWRAAWS